MKNFALLVGITYNSDETKKLLGPVNDVIMFRKYLLEKRYYDDKNISILRDDNINFLKPNRTNILNSLNKLINLANENNSDEVFFYFGGHGNSKNIKETYNSILTYDNDIIEDADIRFLLERLNNKTNMIMVFDCLNPTNNINLPYGYFNKNNIINCISNNSRQDIELMDKNIFLLTGTRNDNKTTAIQPYNVYYDMNVDLSILQKNKYGSIFTSSFLNYAYNNYTFEDIIEFLQTVNTNNLGSNVILYSSQLKNTDFLNKLFAVQNIQPPVYEVQPTPNNQEELIKPKPKPNPTPNKIPSKPPIKKPKKNNSSHPSKNGTKNNASSAGKIIKRK